MNPFLLAAAQIAPCLLIALSLALIRAQIKSHGGKMLAALRLEHTPDREHRL